MVADFKITPITANDRAAIKDILMERWGSEVIVSRGNVHQADQLPGFIALVGNRIVGAITYHIDARSCEIVTLDSLLENHGIGSALVERVFHQSTEAGCSRLWLITTNDNLNALGFYQRRGFRLVAIHVNAIDAARALKPAIPLIGMNRILIYDEFELEMVLEGGNK